MIEIQELEFSYRETPVYRDFSLTLDAQVTGLVGQNGAGKTTLVKLILGLLRPHSGTITVGGYSVQKERNKVLEQVGVMFEHSDFPPWVTLQDHLVFVGKLRGLTHHGAETEAKRLLDLFDLGKWGSSRFSKLSAGMKQKFSLAQAIIGFPPYLFLDEPTANLDVRARGEFLELIRELADQHGTQVILLSHILHDLERTCDEIVFLHQGEVRHQAEMSTLFSTNYIKDYIVRLPDPGVGNRVVDFLQGEGIEVLKVYPMLVEVRLPSSSHYSTLAEMGMGTSITAKRSLLEQIFLEVTGTEITGGT